VPFEVVPGVSSPSGATAYAGIPLTHRDHASSVLFVTAVQRDGVPFDLARVRGLDCTLCVFMGHRHLERIARELVDAAGWAASTPAAVIQWISFPRQRTVTGTLADIAATATAAGLGAPSLLVCGGVVSLREELSWFERQPLFGKRILVTRPAHQAAPTEAALRRRGAEPVLFPTIAIEPPPDPEPLAAAVRELSRYDLVAFTSDNGVAWFFRELDRQGKDARALGRALLAAIGTATARGLAGRGLRADIVADTFIAESLAEAIAARLEPASRVLLPRALVAREALPDILRAAGHTVDVVPVYRTVGARGDLAALLPSIDIVLLTSSSTATELCKLLGADAPSRLAHATIASIGPITSDTARALGLTVAVTATVSTSDGLIAALEEHFARE
jgi:uroporphyrinogen III methyltransferase/synthase